MCLFTEHNEIQENSALITLIIKLLMMSGCIDVSVLLILFFSAFLGVIPVKIHPPIRHQYSSEGRRHQIIHKMTLLFIRINSRNIPSENQNEEVQVLSKYFF